MCEPTTLTVASLALTAASTAAAAYGADQQQRAMNSAASQADRRQADLIRQDSEQNVRAAQEEAQRNRFLMDAENQRQSEFRRQAQSLQDQQIAASSAEEFERQRAAREASSNAEYEKVADQVPMNAPEGIATGGEAASSGVRVVADNMKNSMSKVSDYLRQQAQSRAGLESFGNAILDRTLSMGRANDVLGKIGQMSQNSLGAYGTERNASAGLSNLLFNNIGRNTALQQSISDRRANEAYMNAGYTGQNMGTLSAALSGLSGIGSQWGANERYKNKTI